MTTALLSSQVTGSHDGIERPLLRKPITTLRPSHAPTAIHAAA